MNINQIIEKLTTDKELSEKYAALSGVDAILAQAKADGFDVSREDVQAVLGKLGGKSGELSEDELAVVAGGSDDYKYTCKRCGGEFQACPCYNCLKCGTPMKRTRKSLYSFECPRCDYKANIKDGWHDKY